MRRAAASAASSSSAGALGRMQLRLRTQRTAATATITPRVPAIKEERSPVGTRSSPRIKRQLHSAPPPAQDLTGASSPPGSTPQPRKRAARAKATAPLANATSDFDGPDVSVKAEDASAVELVSSESASPAARKKAKRSSKADESRVKRTAPARWKEMLEGIQTMRAGGGAEVDSMGCEFYKTTKYPPHEWRFHTLVSAMLSSQTKDPVNAAAMERLLARDGGLTVESMLKIDEKELAETIHPVGFYRNKAKYIKQVASILQEQQRATGADVADIPSTFDDLVALPGVGPKMAYLVMDCAWSNVVGICVDTHVHRISNRLGWVKTWNTKNPKAQDPEKTRQELEDWLPREHWGPINLLLVGFGQTICQPRGPKCTECAIRHVCPSAGRSTI